jgi:hypothetical protein
MFRKLLSLALLFALAIYMRNTLLPVIGAVQVSVIFMIDDHWFGTRELFGRISHEFDQYVAPRMELYETMVDLELRRVAVRAYRHHFGNMQSVADRTLWEQQKQMQRVADSLDYAAKVFIRNETILGLMLASKYNTEEDHILPQTWSLVHEVLLWRREFWIKKIELVAERVRGQMRVERTVIAETYEEEHNKPEPTYSERVMEFASEVCVLLGSVGGLYLFKA